MTYEELLGKQPASYLGGNVDAARTFVSAISEFLSGPTSHLATSQRNYLYKLRATWEKRATGHDARWNEFGTSPGRKRKIKGPRPAAGRDRTAYGDEDELDPLLRATLAKFGTRRNA